MIAIMTMGKHDWNLPYQKKAEWNIMDKVHICLYEQRFLFGLAPDDAVCMIFQFSTYQEAIKEFGTKFML